MILPCVGARVRKSEREPVPMPVLRLKKMFCIALNSDVNEDFLLDGDDHRLCASCVACGEDRSCAPLKQCACCLLWWHSTCSQQVSTHVAGFVSANGMQLLHDVDDMTLEDLPFVFLSGNPAPALRLTRDIDTHAHGESHKQGYERVESFYVVV